ncbi:MAG: RNA-binding S4 domain-containing protein [Desulfobulbaceae bacterium]|nr:RNA-binding S4 domain-containing protein [Desulfobulbaceae bacterium]
MHNLPSSSLPASITTDFIELDKLLKRENIAASGGEARWMVSEGLVQVNGVVELRKRRKLYPGDLVQVQDNILRIVAASNSLPG